MSTKRKISVRRIIQAVVTIVVVTGCVFAILSASRIQDNTKLAGIDIRIKNERYGFIDKEEVKNVLLTNRHIDIARTSMKKLDVKQMEDIINANPWIEDAQLYVDNKHVLHVNITQRVPVARLFESNGNSYYLDHTLKSMPLCDRYIHYTTVVTNVPQMKEGDSAGNAFKAQVVSLVQHIEKDSFWNAQISQVIAGGDTTGFELVPVLGEHRILFGDTSHMQEKFDHLFAFYTKVLNRIGWNKYQVLDLRFNGQIVASPALPWKKPQDNTMGNMSWVTSIIESGDKAIESDTPGSPVQATVNATMVVTKADVKPAPTQQQQPAKQIAITAAPAPVKKAEIKQTVVSQPQVKKTGVKKPEVKQAVAATAKPPVKKEIIKAAPPPKKAPEEVNKKTTAAKKPEAIKKEPKKEEQKKEATPKYIYQGSENNNQQ